MSKTAKKIECQLDGARLHYLPPYLAEQHGMTADEYLERFPNAPLESDAVTKAYTEQVKDLERAHPPPPHQLSINLGGCVLRVNPDVPPDACLPLPEHFRLPTQGPLGQAVQRALLYFRAGRSHWIWGPSGSGKDALISAVCALTRTPSEVFQINPDVDILPWFHQRSFDRDGTSWEFGGLFRALVQGHVSPISGRQVPKTIVLSDFDRATSTQAENFRLVMDSILSRVKGPRGETYPVLPGTRIIATANTMGGGDETGKYRSANIVDTSILNRFTRKVKFSPMDWEDEKHIVQAKFPRFMEQCSDLLDKIGGATTALRQQVQDRNLYAEFGHRDVCTWVGACEDILRFTETVPADLLKQGFLSYADGLPDEMTRTAALTIVDPHVPGGALPRGDTSGVNAREISL